MATKTKSAHRKGKTASDDLPDKKTASSSKPGAKTNDKIAAIPAATQLTWP